MKIPVNHSAGYHRLLKRHLRSRGFALIVTLSLMILLTVIAVGLLTLSSISLRSTGQGSDMATARANARMALMLALGELQKNAGPDQRITARADIDSSNTANPRLTGVWKSWNISATSPPSPSDYEKTERDKKFLGWLASSVDGKLSNEVGFAKEATSDPVTLWGQGSLGTTPTASVPTADIVTAAKVPTAHSRGAFAWAVMDEGVKVRINTPHVDDAPTKGMQTAQLGSGVRPNASSIPTLSALESRFFEKNSTDFANIEKGVSRLNLGLAMDHIAAGTASLLKPLAHDVTSSSVGLFTDTAAGGLKEDFNLLTNSLNLPPPYKGADVYSTRLGLPLSKGTTAPNPANPSDPKWDSFFQLARLYQDTSKLSSPGGVPVLKAWAPLNWKAMTPATPPAVVRNPPTGMVLMPTVAKVQVMFSLVGRDLYPDLPAISGPLTVDQKKNSMHGPQDEWFRNTKYDYDLHLIYTPLITLHNPYNVALEFTSMTVSFLHIPFAMKTYRNGVAMSTDYAPLETMFGNNRDGSKDKMFGMVLKTKDASGAPGSDTFRMLPGEVKLFSPYIEPTLTYSTEVRAQQKDRKFWDIDMDHSLTTEIKAIPGWRGDGLGFDCDNLAGNYPIDGSSGKATNGTWTSCVAMAWDDKISVEVVPKNVSRAANKFTVQLSASVAGSSFKNVINAIEMDYGTPDGLKNFLSSNGATMPLRYPKATASPNYVRAQDLVERASLSIGGLVKIRPFALFSLQAKNTSGGRDSSGDDGRLATKPWAFAHANMAATTQKVVTENSANFSHEIDMVPLNGSSANFFSIGEQDRSNFISGNGSLNGTKFGVQYDIPLAPLQTLVSLNSANPGGLSSYLPRFAQPIGNSWAHPLLDTSKIITPGNGYSYLDHSFLLNLALYDHFYFSGFADQIGPFSNSNKKVPDLAGDFTAGKPLVDPRVTLYTPDGKSADVLKSEVSKQGTDLFTKIASWQVMNGAFNINSTSVAAWKAMLGSVRDPKAIFNELNKTSINPISTLKPLKVTDVSRNESRISRFRLPVSDSAAHGEDSKDAYWLGPREYSDAQLQTLAENIVEQVRQRGPFLSMSEFVNRRLGSASDDKAQRGALQQAIDDSNLNQSLAATANAGFDIPSGAVSGYKYANPKAGTGPSYQGAPGYLSQADLLTVLGNAATPRSDTFTIRGYGEARNTAGKTTATATCEAVVQRVPDYLDSTDPANAVPTPISPVTTTSPILTSQTNLTFGRRFNLVSFRWLSPAEI